MAQSPTDETSARLVRRRGSSPEAIADRKSKIDQTADEIAKMPVLDPRSPREIMDDINEL